jgi:hypothetical protein
MDNFDHGEKSIFSIDLPNLTNKKVEEQEKID